MAIKRLKNDPIWKKITVNDCVICVICIFLIRFEKTKGKWVIAERKILARFKYIESEICAFNNCISYEGIKISVLS